MGARTRRHSFALYALRPIIQGFFSYKSGIKAEFKRKSRI